MDWETKPQGLVANLPASVPSQGCGCAPGWCAIAWKVIFSRAQEGNCDGLPVSVRDGKEADEWRAQKGCLIQGSLVKGQLERKEELREARRGR